MNFLQMYFEYVYGKYDEIVHLSPLIVREYSTCGERILDRLENLSKGYGKEALWIVMLDYKWEFAGACTMGTRDDYVEIFNFRIKSKYQNSRLAETILKMCVQYCKDTNKKILTYDYGLYDLLAWVVKSFNGH